MVHVLQPLLPDPRGTLARHVERHVFGPRKGGQTPWDSILFGNTADDVNEVLLAYSNKTVPAGNTVSGTAVETTYASSYTIPANSLVAGDVVRLTLRGTYATVSPGTPASRHWRVYWGSTLMVDTGTITLTALGSNRAWYLRAEFLVQTPGSGESYANNPIEVAGDVPVWDSGLATRGWANDPLVVGSPVHIDLTAAQALTVSSQHGNNSASETDTLRMMIVEHLKTP